MSDDSSADSSVEIQTSLPGAGLFPFGLQDVEQIRLVLRGDSVVDWRRLAFGDKSGVNEFVRRLGLDPHDADDQGRMIDIHRRALEYIETHYDRRIPDGVRSPSDVRQLFLLASRPGPLQLDACMVLKVMHIVYHAEGRELLYRLPVPINELFYRTEAQVFAAVDGMKAAGIRVAELAASRKTQDSIFTKLLCRADSLAAEVHDRLRFRVITETLEDVFSALVYMTRSLLPFNYVLPGASRNDLVDLHATLGADDRMRPLLSLLQQVGGSPRVPVNTFSSRGYRVINFVVDMPVRVDDLIERVPDHSARKGRVIFLLVEFQLVDRETHRLNDTGENQHRLYKERQRVQVFQRLTGKG